MPKAVREVPRESLASILTLYPHVERVYEYDVDWNGPRADRDLSALPQQLQDAHRSLRKLNLCDFFAKLLVLPLRRKLEGITMASNHTFHVLTVTIELELGTVRWARFYPLPKYLFAYLDPDQESPTKHLDRSSIAALHSVLQVTTTADEDIIFDGTPEQFGWSAQCSIMDAEDYKSAHVNPEKKFEALTKEQEESQSRDDLGKYFNLNRVRMGELLEELDWESFESLDDEQLLKWVTIQARDKFEGL